MDSLGSNLGMSCWATELELTLLLMNISASTSGSTLGDVYNEKLLIDIPALMTAITRNSHNKTAENK